MRIHIHKDIIDKPKDCTTNKELYPYYQICILYEAVTNILEFFDITSDNFLELLEDYRIKVFLESGGEFIVKPYLLKDRIFLKININTEICKVNTYEDKKDKLKSFNIKLYVDLLSTMIKCNIGAKNNYKKNK